jgi:DNA-binding response OmpR family regulator
MAQKILIVDDDLDTLQLVGTTLERQGFAITAAKDGEQGLEFARKEHPDLILLDIMMPKMDGYEVTRRLRADPDTAEIPILMFTAKAQVDDKVEGLEVGADDYLTKPTHPSELVARVRALLKRPHTTSLALPPDMAAAAVSKLVIGLIAPKGGLGLTTLAINLGVALHQKTQESVVVVEMRPGRGDISVYLGQKMSDQLSELLQMQPSDIGRADVEKSLVTHTSGTQFLLASARASDAKYASATDQMVTILDQLIHISPYTVLDLGANLTEGNVELLKRCDRVVVAIESTPYTVRQANSLLEELLELGVQRQTLHPILLNRTRTEQALSINDVQKELGYEFSTVLTPAPELAHQAAVAQKPMVSIDPDGLTKQQIDKLLDKLI